VKFAPNHKLFILYRITTSLRGTGYRQYDLMRWQWNHSNG
jgi:hypothetical protein